MMTFRSKPKVRKNGFWSLTAYDGKGYLIPNDLNRASLGDRSALTFPDGTPLSDDSEDGTFQILAQPADNPPPANWTSNWIPTPAGGGVVSLSLRLYGAELEMSDGTWVYPDVKVIDAITE
ncbi:unnamed protein product [Parascedosporium putredinis]|uniref:DUF1214 domain-containing protein n=1 Tax=Parascedosporium putredinis TaxID=1442378 RepID=A0A9P1H1C0_9PEZI|nr:unnamed protein product [Parascedosporium putredinis]CAI7992588.1 unnamed protein product [Parascedosporium putredinis]